MPSTTLAVLRPTPGSFHRSYQVARDLPVIKRQFANSAQHARICLALVRKKPVLWMAHSRSCVEHLGQFERGGPARKELSRHSIDLAHRCTEPTESSRPAIARDSQSAAPTPPRRKPSSADARPARPEKHSASVLAVDFVTAETSLAAGPLFPSGLDPNRRLG